MIIGVCGFARSGKDSVANILVKEWGFTQVAFADGLREALRRLNPHLVASSGKAKLLSDILASRGSFEAIKDTEFADEWRRLQQLMGTEVGREMFGENTWVDIALKDYKPGDHLVVSDVRFPNEVQGIYDRAGGSVAEVWRVTRPGIVAANDHDSEHALADFKPDAGLENDGTLSDLKDKVAQEMAGLTLLYSTV